MSAPTETTAREAKASVQLDASRRNAVRKRWALNVGWKYLLAIVVIFYAVFPLVYILSASFNPGGSLSGSNSLFRAFDLGNYQALSDTRYWTWYGNTLIVGVSAALGAVIMGAAAAYAFSRFRFSGRRVGLTALLIIQMFPQALAFVAIFLMLLSIGEVFPVLGLNSKISLICIYLGGALGVNTFLMYGYFNTIPQELDESAKIDGATHAQIFWRIIMPLVTPILAVVGLLAFIASFGDYIISKIVLVSEDNWTLAVGMFQWVSNQLSSNWGLFAAGAILASIPVLVLFLTLQRYIVGGLTAGSVKG
ncbi:sugar ABC transporter permease [Microbacterium memoriense]|uniref:Sugar ABC transporter permease n=1 Tax=Microbacterium memoriense TaxID=2978350 RepID=A0ABT2PA90_9MICO|nr:sugar ABC transporter permease [Microbacterium memoriense]MCT9000953.1 sugar ABC transporter permease [Microbacterium memoriense]